MQSPMLLRKAKILCLLADHLQQCCEKCCGFGGYGILVTVRKFKKNTWRGQDFPKNNTPLTSCNTYELVHSFSLTLVYYLHQILSTWIKISECFYFQKIVSLMTRCTGTVVHIADKPDIYPTTGGYRKFTLSTGKFNTNKLL